jgi:thymidine phosphorylase
MDRPTVHLAVGAVQKAVPAPRDGILFAQDTRAIGIAVIELGGGRRVATDTIDTRVGFAAVQPLGVELKAGDAMAVVHAADEASADRAIAAYQSACVMADHAPMAHALIAEVIG